MNSKNQILVLKSDPKSFLRPQEAYWDIPGGRIKNNASINETLLEETEEELGTRDINIDRIFDASIANFTIPDQNKKEVRLLLMTYICKLKTEKFKLSEEHTEYKWASIDEAKKLLSVKFAKTFIDKLDELKY